MSSDVDNHKRTNSTIFHLMSSRVKEYIETRSMEASKGDELVGSCYLVGTELSLGIS